MHQTTATFRLAGDVEEPKIGWVRSGYAPHHKFASVDYLVSGFHSYDDEVLHYPGETLNARIRFPSWDGFCDSVKVGDSFEMFELDRLIGHGKIDEIF